MTDRAHTRIFGRLLLGLVSLALAVAACSGGEPSPSTPTQPASRTPTVATQMVDIGGFSLALRCAGSGEPAFIFEGGHADAELSADYSIVQTEMMSQRVTRVCWYDRAGLGESEERPQGVISSEILAEELRALLTEGGIEPPYVLAGGSFGGLLVRTYQATFPNDVVGLMFIDAIEERMARVELGPNRVREGHTVIPMRELTSTLRAADSLGDLPVIVIVASANAADPDWMAGQRRLAALSSNSVTFVARGTTHGVTHEVPELVTEAARQLVEAARSNAPLRPCGGELEALGARCLGR